MFYKPYLTQREDHMPEENQKISVEECTTEVKLMARRAALLHLFFSKAIEEELGEEAGELLIKKAIMAYGEYCGRAIRNGVEALGLPLSDENSEIIPDLPKYGWESDIITLPNGEERPIARFCPLADIFKQFGEEGRRLGRLYCFVDQGKQIGYNPDFDFIHSKNVLDGDAYCEFLVIPHKG
jgi:hypothetical protein